ncbi:quinone-dependent dihydroorotate dehydrogenase [Desmospora profundinema]|uniref:quinone-dependent dihydroorotate dehydrogenase n=1 Tax=Desmospora profundinema TaxID=1571184 RepID=UPI00286D1DE2|nr:quinone-dependent dihydroorotate dehydrogenase [Desmospora profundinema]
MYALFKPWLFRLDPEAAHEWTIRSLKVTQTIPGVLPALQWKHRLDAPSLSVDCLRLRFPNPVGLAAGFDKHASVYPALAAWGFGFVEVGTLTPLPQPGNPRPRLFRLPEDEAVINRMGFNNAGVEAARQSFSRLKRPDIPIGINLGKNKDTPAHDAAADYCKGLRSLYRSGDYFVINISSPNTKGLRDLQQADSLEALLREVMDERHRLQQETGEIRPLLLKVAPDLDEKGLEDAVSIAMTQGIDGLIVSNTTLSREGIKHRHREETGGLSGRPLAARSTAMIRQVRRLTGGKAPIIGVGGIFDGQDALDKIKAGASLVQIYTGMIYRGPGIARRVNEELLHLLEKEGFSHVSEAVGVDA